MYKLIILFLLAVTSCGSQQSTTESMQESQQTALQEGEISIPMGDSIEFGGEKITFVQVIEDSRCPVGTQCVWAGLAKIQVHFAKDEISFERTTATLENGKPDVIFENNSHTFTAISLSPEPKDGDGGRRDYVIKIQVQKKK